MIKNHSVAFAWFGIIAAFAFAVVWIGAAAIESSWTFGDAAISDLGTGDSDASLFFNVGCIITGALVAIFGIREMINDNDAYVIGGILFIIAGVLLALVGVIPSDYGNGDLHNFIATTMGIVALGAVIAISAGNWYAHREYFAGISIVIIGLLIATYFAESFESFEAWAVILALVWITIESGRMIAFNKKA